MSDTSERMSIEATAEVYERYVAGHGDDPAYDDAMHGKVWLTTLLAAVLGLGLLLAGLASVRPLLTASDDPLGCFTAGTTGMLIVNAEAGTAIVQEDMGKSTVPVRWPKGYTSRRIGDQVEVLDTAGRVVARTGRRYYLPGGYENGTWLTCTDGVSSR